jgi:hypothetical protein
MALLRERLDLVAGGSFDRDANLEPLVALIRDQGCDLEADILPIVAREVPELPRPLKNWGAAWLARDILAARDQRVHGVPPSVEHFDPEVLPVEWDESGRIANVRTVQRTPAIGTGCRA